MRYYVFFCFLVFNTPRSEGFSVLKKVKNFLLPPTTTTSTTAATPIVVPEYEKDHGIQPSPTLANGEQGGNDLRELPTTEKNKEGPYPQEGDFDSGVSSTKTQSYENNNEESSSTLTKPSNNKKYEIKNLTIIGPGNQGIYPGMPTTTLPLDTHEYQPYQPTANEYSTNKVVPTTIPEDSQLQPSRPSYTDFNSGGETPALPTDDGRLNNQPQPDRPKTSNSLDHEKPVYNSPQQPDPYVYPNEERIIYPDHPSLSSTPQPSKIYVEVNASTVVPPKKLQVEDYARAVIVPPVKFRVEDNANTVVPPRELQVEDSTRADVVPSSTSRSAKSGGAAVDGGRRIINAPEKDCGPNQRADGSGTCRPIARK